MGGKKFRGKMTQIDAILHLIYFFSFLRKNDEKQNFRGKTGQKIVCEKKRIFVFFPQHFFSFRFQKKIASLFISGTQISNAK